MKFEDLRVVNMEGLFALDSTIQLFRTLSRLNLFPIGATRFTKHFLNYVVKHGHDRLFRD